MYESYHKLVAKPFQLKPDPDFFYGSKGHRRAMAYLEYGLSQGDGFIVITGEIGAGKTTLVRNLLRKVHQQNIVAAQIVNTQVDADDIVRSVVAAFGLPFLDASKAVLLVRLEQFLRQCDAQGKRALLVVDEAQNLSARAVEELRMLSNFQTEERALLQTFLLGQPEFRRTLLGPGMQQLHQRVIATYHLGPLDSDDTRSYIEHRLRKAGWNGDPTLDDSAFATIFDYAGGIPRKVNALCNRLFLRGFLDELHAFSGKDVAEVIADMQEEARSTAAADNPESSLEVRHLPAAPALPPEFEYINGRLERMERSVLSMLDVMRKMLASSISRNHQGEK